MPLHSSALHAHLRAQGFSLVELLVVVALLGILAGLAGPSFTGQFQRYRVDAVREDLIASLQLARTEAIRRGQTVVIEKQTNCAVTLASGQDWSCGWILYPDLNGNASRDAATEPIIQTQDLPPRVTVTKGANNPLNRVASDRFGQLQPIAISFAIAPANGTAANSAVLCIGAGSRVRTIKGATTCPTT